MGTSVRRLSSKLACQGPGQRGAPRIGLRYSLRVIYSHHPVILYCCWEMLLGRQCTTRRRIIAVKTMFQGLILRTPSLCNSWLSILSNVCKLQCMPSLRRYLQRSRKSWDCGDEAVEHANDCEMPARVRKVSRAQGGKDSRVIDCVSSFRKVRIYTCFGSRMRSSNPKLRTSGQLRTE